MHIVYRQQYITITSVINHVYISRKDHYMVRSDRVAKGATRAPHRSLLKALGFITRKLENQSSGLPILSMKSFQVMYI